MSSDGIKPLLWFFFGNFIKFPLMKEEKNSLQWMMVRIYACKSSHRSQIQFEWATSSSSFTWTPIFIFSSHFVYNADYGNKMKIFFRFIFLTLRCHICFSFPFIIVFCGLLFIRNESEMCQEYHLEQHQLKMIGRMWMWWNKQYYHLFVNIPWSVAAATAVVVDSFILMTALKATCYFHIVTFFLLNRLDLEL